VLYIPCPPSAPCSPPASGLTASDQMESALARLCFLMGMP
jgi:hypothetical protein